MERLEKQFFIIPTLQLATALLGKTFVRILPGNRVLKGRIVETEAYLGEGDEASHAWRGKTDRNGPMFEAPGTLYVYFVYGCHHLVNIVSEPRETAGAVLLRAMEPLEGQGFMERQRGTASASDLMSGPAKIAQALDINRSHSGSDLFSGEFFLENAPRIPENQIGTSSRIGISRGRELQWRKFVIGSPHLSQGQPS
ncbi:DNA-3-methyladenine glycosylase [Chlorobium phaeovibrioides]|uniref:Putative 3-methyladenine DNA glycosylase n=1 Tax=Chlorobium phaeovibrioides TaxID=1094 RepID=A0A5M8IAA9_CHLPH|nr:DNA-3-methyladenine glycosylase [Chlorobium phaeovibrioides]KAA6232017.1 DNA-3-methyladenine glycosylase [Chlorobium phaeovibrioides]QEQ57427.1 DNA-3-methyladenine glycosylase [Chlorobium phaeovibrioides]